MFGCHFLGTIYSPKADQDRLCDCRIALRRGWPVRGNLASIPRQIDGFRAVRSRSASRCRRGKSSARSCITNAFEERTSCNADNPLGRANSSFDKWNESRGDPHRIL